MLYHAIPGRGKPTQRLDGLELVTMLSKQATIAVALSMAMVMAAGCAGWGTDGSANPDEETNGNGETQTNESSGDGQETESDDSGTEEEQQDGEADSDKSTSTDSPEEPSSEANTDETDANGPSETDDGETVDSTEETDTTDETGTDSSQADSDQGDGSPSSNGGGDSGDGSPASEGNNENGGEEPSENDGNEDSDNSNENGDETPTNGDDEAEETHALTVQVYDSDGEPVEGADVSLITYDAGEDVDSGVTDANGQVEFEVPNGDYEVLVSGTEDAQSSSNRLTSVQGEDTAFTVNLYDPNDNMHSYSATIRVVDEDGNPIPNEYVRIGNVAGGEENYQGYITDENGEVEVGFGNSSLDDAVQYEAIVRGEVYPFSIDRGVQTETITATGERETHQLEVIAGEVYPVEGVEVTIERWDGQTTTRTTDEDGTTSFEVYPGEYTVTGEYDGETHSEDVTVEEDTSVLFDFEVEPPEQVETTLTVVDQDGNPVEGVSVEAMTSIPPTGADMYIQSDYTDENGQVTVEAHAGQTYSIDRVVDEDGNSYDDRGNTLTVDENGESDEIVVERPEQDAQQSVAA